jgi:hypothetical protein
MGVCVLKFMIWISLVFPCLANSAEPNETQHWTRQYCSHQFYAGVKTKFVPEHIWEPKEELICETIIGYSFAQANPVLTLAMVQEGIEISNTKQILKAYSPAQIAELVKQVVASLQRGGYIIDKPVLWSGFPATSHDLEFLGDLASGTVTGAARRLSSAIRTHRPDGFRYVPFAEYPVE